MNNMITTCHLTKKYKSFTAVNDVSLHIQKGRIYGFLGPNGAGKSTTMKMLLGLTAPTKGSFTINGKHFPDDRLEILKGIGSLIEAPSFYANLTGRENLDIIRKLIGESTNLNQLAKRANAYGFYRVADECRTVTQQISQLIKQLKDDR